MPGLLHLFIRAGTAAALAAGAVLAVMAGALAGGAAGHLAWAVGGLLIGLGLSLVIAARRGAALAQENERLRLARDKADVANRAKSEFLANMSHELRTPLNAVIGFSDAMLAELHGPLDARYADYVRHIKDSGAHLLEVINDILDVSKIEAGRMELCEEPVEPASVVGAAVRLVRERAAEAGLTVQARVPDGLPVLTGDKRRIMQILLNLLSNAIKFTPADGHVVVSVQRNAAGDLVLAVEDTGIGMAVEDVGEAMVPFGQVDSALGRRHAGTGLGLPLTRSLVELHGGSLEVSSRAGEGTTVRAIFPAARLRARDPAAVSG